MQYRLYRTHITLFLMIQNHRKEHTMILFPFLLATTVGLLLVIAGALPFASASVPHLKNATLLTPDEIAAGGPIPPNYTLAKQEVECTIAEQNAPWYPTMLSYEHHDGNRYSSVRVRHVHWFLY